MEIWKDIPKTNGFYQASTMGRIRSLDAFRPYMKKYTRFHKGRVLVPRVVTGGYLQVSIVVENKLKQISIHRLVAFTFVENTNGYPEVNHKNGVKTDNRPENLEWCTRKHNVRHAVKNGLAHIGSLNGIAILDEKQVYFIKVLLNIGETHQSISDRFPVSRDAITQIAIGNNWKHVQLEKSLVQCQ